MKLSSTALLALLVSATAVSAAPTQITAENVNTNSLVKKSDVNDVLALIEQLGQNKQKRDLIEDEHELIEFDKRQDSLLAQLITALQNSGLIADIWKILTTDTALRTVVVGLVKKAIQGAIADGPALIQALWQSNLLQTIFKDVFENSQLRPILFSIGKAIFQSGLNLLKAFLASRTGGTSTPSGASKREAEAVRFDEISALNADEYIDKRDMMAVAEQVYTAIKNTGLVQGLVQKALANPQASISLLTNVLKQGWVVGEDIYNWANQSGLLKKGLQWMSANGATYANDVAKFLGNMITQGKASVSDVDNAAPISYSSTSTPTTGATTSSGNQRRYY